MSYTACFHASTVAKKVIVSLKDNGLTYDESTKFKESIKTLIRYKAQMQIEHILHYMQSELTLEQLQMETSQRLINFIAVNCRQNFLEINSKLIPPDNSDTSVSENKSLTIAAPAA